MAEQKKKTTTKKTSTKQVWGYDRIAGLLALISMFITGICYMVNFILKFFGGGVTLGVLSLIANLFMLLAVVMISWRSLKKAHLPGKKLVWVIIYWVIVALAVVGQFALM